MAIPTSVTGWPAKPIPDSLFGDQDAWSIGIGLDLTAEPANKNSQIMYVIDMLITPYLAQQKVMGQDLTRVLRQNPQ